MQSIIARSYRPDIDGLRAIAVLSVLFFHFGVDEFSGGFVGVDIFFVISGYLITSQISKELTEGGFSFLHFYERRARRLFPALFALLCLVLLISFFVLIPDHFSQLGESTIYAALSLSNVLFYIKTGYFDSDAVVKPLLHTWSLGVEEQFYFIWPFLLFLLIGSARRVSRLSVLFSLVLIGVVSLLTSQYLVIHDPSAAFYLPQSRIFQFAIGAMLVYWPRDNIENRAAQEVILFVGLALICYSIFVFSEKTDFPGFNALVPSVGASLMILGGRSHYLGVILRNPVFVFTGKISYSLYLWHWPILVFYLYLFGPELTITVQLVLLMLCYFVAYISYRYVEVPFRKKNEKYVYLNGSDFGLVFCLLLLPVLFISSNIWANHGWQFRYGLPDKDALSELYNVDQLRESSSEYFKENVNSPYLEAEGSKKTVVVIGDSHAKDVANALHLSLPKGDYEIGMLPFNDDCVYIFTEEMDKIKKSDQKYCLKQKRVLEQSKKVHEADLVLISQAWKRNTAELSPYLVRKISQISNRSSQEIIVLGRMPDFLNFQNAAIKLISKGETKDQINAIAFEKVHARNDIDRILERLSEENQYKFISKYPLICQAAACDFFSPEGYLTVWDKNHWTLNGASLFGKRLSERLLLSR